HHVRTGKVARAAGDLFDIGPIDVALYRQTAIGLAPVHPEPRLRAARRVADARTGFEAAVVDVEVFRIHAVVAAAERAAVARRAAAFTIAAAGREHHARGICRALRDDVDDSVDRVRAPE